MKKYILFSMILLAVTGIQALTVDEIISKVDNNMVSRNMVYKADMTITDGGDIRDMSMDIFFKDEDNALIEVIESSTGHTNRVLKKDGQMFLYIPSAGVSIKIKGHMIKEGFMGSDFSYEDISENRKISELYDTELIESDSMYIIVMKAKVNEAPYKMKKSYIKKDIFLPMKEEIYSSSERLLKVFEILDYKKINEKYIPTDMTMRDMLKENSITEIKYTDVKIKDRLDDKYFQKSYFER